MLRHTSLQAVIDCNYLLQFAVRCCSAHKTEPSINAIKTRQEILLTLVAVVLTVYKITLGKSRQINVQTLNGEAL